MLADIKSQGWEHDAPHIFTLDEIFDPARPNPDTWGWTEQTPDGYYTPFFETWQATLALRSQLEAEVAQHIFDAILTDDAALKGLGVAHVFRDAEIESGRVPAFILRELKQGPGVHIKTNAYKYQQKLDRELARIRRIQTLQARLVALSGTAIASVFIGLSSLGSLIAYEFIYGDDAAQAS